LIVKDFTLVSGGHDSSLRVWDLRKMQILYEVPVRIYYIKNNDNSLIEGRMMKLFFALKNIQPNQLCLVEAQTQ